jgi:hypothetical protein
MCASCATSSRAGSGRSGREPRTSGDAELSPVDRRHPQGRRERSRNAITAATARSMRRAESLCSFTIRCPRESLRTTALPTCRARSGSPKWVNARLNTASPNRWGDCGESRLVGTRCQTLAHAESRTFEVRAKRASKSAHRESRDNCLYGRLVPRAGASRREITRTAVGSAAGRSKRRRQLRRRSRLPGRFTAPTYTPPRTSTVPTANDHVMRSSWSQADTGTVTSGMRTSW